ncbi:MAG: hypothetical protein ACTS9Y_00145 [Methylophilus sp.]|uniref:hypothetical protein n=1 Tax=Methylophilus sp. TaxID=29541 RepID=UPI003F9FAD26
MKRTLIFLLAVALLNPTSILAQDKEDAATMRYQNIPLGYSFEYSDPFVILEHEGIKDDLKPVILINERNQDTLRIDVFKNANKKSLPIRALIESEYPETHPPEAFNVVREVNTTGTQYIVKYQLKNLYYTITFSTFNATDVIVLSYQSTIDFSVAPQAKTVIASIRTVKN